MGIEKLQEQYRVKKDNLPAEIYDMKYSIAENRCWSVIDFLMTDDFLLEYGITEPIVSDLEYSTFEKELQKAHFFDDLPRFIKEKIYKAERISYYETLFKKYLEDRDITVKEFKAKNPKIKDDIIHDWLFLNNLSDTILNFD